MSRSKPPNGAATAIRERSYSASKRSRTRSPTACRSAGVAKGTIWPPTTVRSSVYSNANCLAARDRSRCGAIAGSPTVLAARYPRARPSAWRNTERYGSRVRRARRFASLPGSYRTRGRIASAPGYGDEAVAASASPTAADEGTPVAPATSARVAPSAPSAIHRDRVRPCMGSGPYRPAPPVVHVRDQSTCAIAWITEAGECADDRPVDADELQVAARAAARAAGGLVGVPTCDRAADERRELVLEVRDDRPDAGVDEPLRALLQHRVVAEARGRGDHAVGDPPPQRRIGIVRLRPQAGLEVRPQRCRPDP